MNFDYNSETFIEEDYIPDIISNMFSDIKAPEFKKLGLSLDDINSLNYFSVDYIMEYGIESGDICFDNISELEEDIEYFLDCIHLAPTDLFIHHFLGVNNLTSDELIDMLNSKYHYDVIAFNNDFMCDLNYIESFGEDYILYIVR